MRKLVKDSEDNVMVLVSSNGFIPDGYTLVAEEEIAAEELILARSNKMGEVRAKRNAMLLKNDTAFVIAQKDAASTTGISADAVILRDLPESAQTAVDALTTVEDIKAYDAFAGLTLSRSYE
jgi:hypothetical protein